MRCYGDAAVLTGALVERQGGHARHGDGWRPVSGHLTRAGAD